MFKKTLYRSLLKKPGSFKLINLANVDIPHRKRELLRASEYAVNLKSVVNTVISSSFAKFHMLKHFPDRIRHMLLFSIKKILVSVSNWNLGSYCMDLIELWTLVCHSLTSPFDRQKTTSPASSLMITLTILVSLRIRRFIWPFDTSHTFK